jgi:hypothetical protein
MVEIVKDSFDPVKYFLDPDKHSFDLVDRFVQEVFSRLPTNAWFFANPYDVPIQYYYQQIRHQRTDLNCPLLFSFSIPEEEQEQIANLINRRIAKHDQVFVSKFILNLLQPRLVYQIIKPIKIHNQEIYRLY